MNKVDQRNAKAEGDNVGRDKITNVLAAERRTQIDRWLERLAAEIRDDESTHGFVDSLQYYLQPAPDDSIIGLEAKLDHSGRGEQKSNALRRKEAFSKLLAEWQAYPSAQEIIAYFLSQIDASFECEIKPLLGQVSPEEVDVLVLHKLIKPVLQEMGDGPFMLNHTNVSGMVYWLAERCYIRWHE